MHFCQRALALVFMLSALVVVCGICKADVQYTVTDLETSQTYTNTHAYAINAKGQIAGESYLTENAAFWDNGIAQFFHARAVAWAINDSGVVAGTHNGIAYTWQNNIITDLPLPAGTNYSQANGINNRGQAVGEVDGFAYYSDNPHPCLWTDGKARDLGTSGYEFGWAFDINNKGLVVGTLGYNENANRKEKRHTFLWDDSKPEGKKFTDLGALRSPYDVSYAFALNDASQVVGYSFVGDRETRHAVLWHDGQMQDIHPALPRWKNSVAYAINAGGAVVGNLDDGHFPYSIHAFLYKDGAMSDLNDLIDSKSGWTLIDARGINDTGQIVGYGLHDGKEHAFLLTPTTVSYGSNILHLQTRYSDGKPVDVDGIVCDNLRGMDETLLDCIVIPLPSELQNVALDAPEVTDMPAGRSGTDDPGVGSAKIVGSEIRYYPPAEFNRKQEPRGGHPEDITKEATRAVYLRISGLIAGKRVVVEPKRIILARPPVVLVHGINSTPERWLELMANVQILAETRVPFVLVNHHQSYVGNGPVEVGASLLSNSITRAIDEIRHGNPLPGGAVQLTSDGLVPFSDYSGHALAIRRADIVAWSYGGVITRWYLASNGSMESLRWYDPKRHYAIDLPAPPKYNDDVRKVITLGSMWRGVPLVNYVNEIEYSPSDKGVYFSSAPVALGLSNLGHVLFELNTNYVRPTPTKVPSMEVLAVNSPWMSQLLYRNPLYGDPVRRNASIVPKPFLEQVAYGSVAGDNDAYLPGILPLSPSPYTAIHQLQQYSWFPYLSLEYKRGAEQNYTDGLVPLWSSAIPGEYGKSYVRVHTNHSDYPGDLDTRDYILRSLNSTDMPIGSELNKVWQGSDPAIANAVQSMDGKSWNFSPVEMAPYPQSELYIQAAGVGRLNANAIFTKPLKLEVRASKVVRTGGAFVVQLSVKNTQPYLLADVRVTPDTHLGPEQPTGSLPALQTLLPAGQPGSEKVCTLYFAGGAFKPGVKPVLVVSFSLGPTEKVLDVFLRITIP